MAVVKPSAVTDFRKLLMALGSRGETLFTSPITRRYPVQVTERDLELYGPRAANILALDSFLKEGLDERVGRNVFNEQRDIMFDDEVRKNRIRSMNAYRDENPERRLQAENALDRLTDTVVNKRRDLPEDIQYSLVDPTLVETYGREIALPNYEYFMRPVNNAYLMSQKAPQFTGAELETLSRLQQLRPDLRPSELAQVMGFIQRGVVDPHLAVDIVDVNTGVPMKEVLEMFPMWAS